ncbi:MAG TPA: hypothetical protein VKE98_09410 [Gemmataceae bacterium]|nr:hypothetical protein [Gemmataceae bacterium]
MFRIILVLILVGLIALAFYLGWVHITTSTSQDQSERNVTLSINQGKIKNSVDALRGKGEGKNAENPKGITETKIQGKVQSISSGEIKVKTGSDQMVTIAIGRETEMQGNPAPGDAVTVSYTTADNRHVATSIRKE